MRTKISRWGNSLGIRIPKAFAEEVEVSEGSEVDLSIVHGRLILEPVEESYRLEALLDRVTEENLHGEILTGEPRGRESW